MSLFDPDKSAERLPVTLITGFLGSGKTTLLNRVLGDPRMARSLVLVNEFGEVGLDHLFMEQVGGDMVLLQSGLRVLHHPGRSGQHPARHRPPPRKGRDAALRPSAAGVRRALPIPRRSYSSCSITR